MRVPQILLLLIIAVRVNSDGIPFVFCSDNDDCPLNATCVEVNDESGCVCDGKLYPFIPPIKVAEDVMFLCTPVVCFPSDENPCSGKGECVVEFGRYVCKCYEGYYGETCEELVTSTTTPKMTETTTRRGGYGGLLAAAGAGLFAVVLLGASAAALTSSSG
uniref:Slit homolog 2 protein-like isoform X1 n=1 Tax=Crassostrea virginica TaxID=6565 RepID=A0A8B8CBA0_CRAVI|nr:slit homolog 2 protein-like isoform X1 [Crassostrea virginica]